jgi:hypothetical protein
MDASTRYGDSGVSRTVFRRGLGGHLPTVNGGVVYAVDNDRAICAGGESLWGGGESLGRGERPKSPEVQMANG